MTIQQTVLLVVITTAVLLPVQATVTSTVTQYTPVFLVLASIQYTEANLTCAELQVGNFIHLRPKFTVNR